MGLIIGLVVGSLFLVCMAVLGYIVFDILRDRKRQRQSMMGLGLGRSSGGGSSTSGAGGRTARLIRPEDEAGGGSGGDAAGGKSDEATGLPGTWVLGRACWGACVRVGSGVCGRASGG